MRSLVWLLAVLLAGCASSGERPVETIVPQADPAVLGTPVSVTESPKMGSGGSAGSGGPHQADSARESSKSGDEDDSEDFEDDSEDEAKDCGWRCGECRKPGRGLGWGKKC